MLKNQKTENNIKKKVNGDAIRVGLQPGGLFFVVVRSKVYEKKEDVDRMDRIRKEKKNKNKKSRTMEQ